MERKPDADDIAAAALRLKHDPAYDSIQRGWIGNLYHVTDVQNAASILAMGRLLCHDEAVRAGVLQTAASAAEIMGGTPGWVHRHVRLYFRPKTPTFYRNEGLRPAGDRWKGAHCPVPVAFVFDAPSILGRMGTKWSAGNLASHANPVIGDDVASFLASPFDRIYDRRAPYETNDASTTIHHQQAEVIVPDELSLDSLRAVFVRSPADRQTLRTLVNADGGDIGALDRYLRINHSEFCCRQTIIEDVQLVDAGRQVRVVCTPPMSGLPRFSARACWGDAAGWQCEEAFSYDLDPRHAWRAAVPEALRNNRFRLALWLDDALAFTGWFDPAGNDVLIPPARP